MIFKAKKSCRKTHQNSPSNFIFSILTGTKTLIMSVFIVLLTGFKVYAAGLTVPAGSTLNIMASTLNVPGNMVIAGTLEATTGTIALTGDWTNTGTFTPGTGTVVFNGTGQQNVFDANTFSNLTATTTTARTIGFEEDQTQTVNGTATLTGSAGQLLSLRTVNTSGTILNDGSQSTIDFQGMETTDFLDVRDHIATSTNAAVRLPINPGNSTDSGNNSSWFGGFGVTVDQDSSQLDPTGLDSATFEVVFATAIDPSTFVAGDVTLSGTTGTVTSGPTEVAPNDGTTFAFTVTGMTNGDIVIASLGENVVSTAMSQFNGASSSTDNSVTYDITTDTDGDGIADAVEGSGPNSGDGNDDGTPDFQQDSVVTFLDQSTAGFKTLEVTSGGCNVFQSPASVLESSLSQEDPFFDYPFGLLDFQLNCLAAGDSADIQLYFHEVTDLSSFLLRKFGRTAPGAATQTFADVSGAVTLGSSTVGGTPVGVATYTITDGVAGDDDSVAAANAVLFDPVGPAVAGAGFVRLSKEANKKEVQVGSVVTYTITAENVHDAVTLSHVVIEDKIPAGFKYLEGKVRLQGQQIADPSGTRPLRFSIEALAPGETKILKYQLVVGSGVTFGDYENTAFAKQTITNNRVSNIVTEVVQVVPDVLFDLGTVIGKVFYDVNENGLQDPPEYLYQMDRTITEDPVPNVRIVMEDGTEIVTDQYGRFSVPAILPGRHLFRIDERTLPEGSRLTTNKVVVVDVTEGLLSKVNFGVKFSKEHSIKEQQRSFQKKINILQNQAKPQPQLNVSLFKKELIFYEGELNEPAEFRIFTNYYPFIEQWELEVLDRETKKLVQSFRGHRHNIHMPILWDGKDRRGDPLRSDRNYVYVLVVEDARGRKDETKEKPLIVITSDEDPNISVSEESIQSRRVEHQRWMQEQQKQNHLNQQNIPISGETVMIDLLASNPRGIKILQSGNLHTEIPMKSPYRVRAKDLLESQDFDSLDQQEKIEIILPRGQYEIQVVPLGGEDGYPVPSPKSQVIGQQSSTMDLESEVGSAESIYSQNIKVGDDYLFFVAMGDGKVGYTFNQGHVEPVQPNDKFQKGFWAEGKIAYYLKGKVLGKYLITSSLDTQREKKELFRNLDPEQYYPVYGDESSINYSATDTQGALYLLVEWDKSSILWGNYNIGFTDTEFAQFNRTLFGGKVHYESVSTTPYGDSVTKVVVFRAQVQQKSAHNEFLGTGGSLYYLKHKDVIEGSEKIQIEVRDKITGLVISSHDVEEGADYEIDYESARILFWKPVALTVGSESIISNNLLDGNPVYVVVDYEYEVEDDFEEASLGARISQAIGDALVIGGTYVKETQDAADYQLQGVDATLYLGEDASITAEYAQSESESNGIFVSTDGGLSFVELPTADAARGQAYGIKGDARIFNRLGLTSYYKWIDHDFSSTATTAQQGKELIGFGVTYDLTPNTRFSAQHDIQKLIEDGNLQTELQVGAQETRTTFLQVIHELRRLRLTAEYRRQEVDEKKEEFESETNAEEDLVAFRADYALTEKIDVALEQQITLEGEKNDQTTLGMTIRPNDQWTVSVEETIGTQGVATAVGVSSKVHENIALTGDYTLRRDREGRFGQDASVGAIAELNDQTQWHAALGVAETEDQESAASLNFGGSAQVDEKTTIEANLGVLQSASDREQTIDLTTKKELQEGLELVSNRSFVTADDQTTRSNTYGLLREKNGKKLEGSFTSENAESSEEISRSNIFGLSGDLNDRFSLSGSFERGVVQDHSGDQSDRNALALGLGFVNKDKETGKVNLKSSSKMELRLDSGLEDKTQYLFYNATEGKINPNTTIFSKLEFSQTRNKTTDFVEAEYKEAVLGGAYRPIHFDRLNLLGKYTYLEGESPDSQVDIEDIEEERAHVFALEGVYDLTDRWQFSEKFAYRISEEKVVDFDFTRTQTWLMLHRLNYKINKDWKVSGEYRLLTQKEAEDSRQGFLLEASYLVQGLGEVGFGYNFTDFDDDLTNLDYTAQGPFVRVTGTLYDRSPEEIEEARIKRLDAKVDQWAWDMVNEVLVDEQSLIVQELNHYFQLAQRFEEGGQKDRAQKAYRDIIRAGELMHWEAAEFIRQQIVFEKQIQEYDRMAAQYLKGGALEEAKEIYEKMIEAIEQGMLK